MGEDTESGLRGIQVFLDAQAISSAGAAGLSQAAYWVALRQEVLTAFSKQRALRLSLGPCEPYRTFDPADDYVWANRLVIHCADVLQYCFGSEEEVLGIPPNSTRSSPHLHPNDTIASARHPLSTGTTIAAADMSSAYRTTRYEELFAFGAL